MTSELVDEAKSRLCWAKCKPLFFLLKFRIYAKNGLGHSDAKGTSQHNIG